MAGVTIGVLVISAVVLFGALGLGIRAVSRRQHVDFYDPAAGAALRESQANTSANGFVGRGGGVGAGGNFDGH